MEEKMTEETKEVLLQNLKALRNLMGKSQENVGEDTNLGRSTISSYETGRRVPPLETMQILADYYGVSVSYLLTNANTNAEDMLNMCLPNLKFLIKEHFLDISPLPENLKDELLDYYRYMLSRAIAGNRQKRLKKT